ncbi:uncharacterized protein EI90DRAFT_3064486 [Cantharellus anzutake]|uniref:uncharacterized protein n=1 Tax=Cantharellus anzutake TaxID=1750568 RepID=UPI001902F1F4|nr:uncharacterized protein EI90DRAFT_3064486 [Cantharellus anzutake]KAF8328532.1 hypothetical protein EI90DRAFT_3064486 [Cantharellus anzutake]
MMHFNAYRGCSNLRASVPHETHWGKCFDNYVAGDWSLETTAKLVDALNSYLSTKNIPDFERRPDALMRMRITVLCCIQRGFQYMLFFVEDRHESSIRINVDLGLRRFIDRTRLTSHCIT